MILKQVIKCDNARAIEATWVVQHQLPDVLVPEMELPPGLNAEGEEVPGEIMPARTIPGEVIETAVRCHTYADVQLDLFRADVAQYGGDISAHETLIAEMEAGIVPPAPPTLGQRIAALDQALTDHLDATARQRRYDDRIACAVRAGYEGPFKAEGQAFAKWMDACNALAYQLLAEVQAGKRPLPEDPNELLALLPPMAWPT